MVQISKLWCPTASVAFRITQADPRCYLSFVGHLHDVFPPVFSISSTRQTWTIAAGTVERLNYGNYEIMSGIIAPSGATSVTLQFTSFVTEFTFDFVYLSSCTAVDCTQKSLINQYSGSTIPSPVTSNTGIMLIEWTSDGTVAYSGWSATWTSQTITCEISLSHWQYRVWLRDKWQGKGKREACQKEIQIDQAQRHLSQQFGSPSARMDA